MSLAYPDVFVSGAIEGHRLRHVGPQLLFDELDKVLDFILDDRESIIPRWRAGEYMLGVAQGWTREP